MASFRSRAYAGDLDLPLLTRFASESLGERFPHDAQWHPGDIAWDLCCFIDEEDVRLWLEGERVVAAAWFDGPDQLCMETRPALTEVASDVLAWGDARLASKSADPGAALKVRAFNTDASRTRLLQGLGYERARAGAVHFRRDLALPIPEMSLPEGMAIVDCRDIDLDQRVACHRDAWSHLEEIGIKDAESGFSGEHYLRLRSMAAYDPELDLLVRTGEGELVANCICWTDEASRIGTFEPLGVCAAWRRQGLARELIFEGLRRLKQRGMAWARIHTANYNTPAIAAYLSCGFEVLDEARFWTRGA